MLSLGDDPWAYKTGLRWGAAGDGNGRGEDSQGRRTPAKLAKTGTEVNGIRLREAVSAPAQQVALTKVLGGADIALHVGAIVFARDKGALKARNARNHR